MPNDVTTGPRYGVTLYGTRGVLFVPLLEVPSEPAMILRSRRWSRDGAADAWERIEPPSGYTTAREAANRRMVEDLLSAIDNNREPVCNARDGRWTIDMVLGIYESQLRGGRVELPLRHRRHPLA
jgi:predicted dehydrogenase